MPTFIPTLLAPSPGNRDVEHGEQGDPHKVDEVPVDRGGLDGLVPDRRDLAGHRLRAHDGQQHHPHDRGAGATDGPFVGEQLRRAHGVDPPSITAAPARRWSYTGRRDRTWGRTSKLWGGGGEVVAHSSVLPAAHASLGASFGL